MLISRHYNEISLCFCHLFVGQDLAEILFSEITIIARKF